MIAYSAALAPLASDQRRRGLVTSFPPESRFLRPTPALAANWILAPGEIWRKLPFDMVSRRGKLDRTF